MVEDCLFFIPSFLAIDSIPNAEEKDILCKCNAYCG
jgi:hypothetical protein